MTNVSKHRYLRHLSLIIRILRRIAAQTVLEFEFWRGRKRHPRYTMLFFLPKFTIIRILMLLWGKIPKLSFTPPLSGYPFSRPRATIHRYLRWISASAKIRYSRISGQPRPPSPPLELSPQSRINSLLSYKPFGDPLSLL